MPVFKVKLKMNGRLCTYDLVANMRYGSTGDRRTILKFEQTFRSFLKIEYPKFLIWIEKIKNLAKKYYSF